MRMMEKVFEKAKKDLRKIVLPEGEEGRTVQAAAILKAEGLAEIVLLGNPEIIREEAAQRGVSVEGIELIDPTDSPKAAEYAEELYELRKAKGVTPEDAAALVADPMYYGIMMVKTGDADGLVSGAYGIPEPCGREVPDITAQTICIVPGYAFAADGMRLGKGGGYYDRFLAEHPALFTLGLTYAFLLQEEIPCQEHDIGVNAVITDRKSSFGGNHG